jgi:molybdopterin-guanine dinucleotide biosynthesis protein A
MRLLGAILAGGASRRFGSDKGIAMLGGRALINHAADALDPLVERIVICGRNLPNFGRLDDRPGPNMGPLGGLNAALHFAASNAFDGVLTLGCDTPVVPSQTLRDLLKEKTGAYIATLPIIGYWPASLSGTLDAHLASTTDYAVRAWAHANGLRSLDRTGIANINFRSDLAALEHTRG